MCFVLFLLEASPLFFKIMELLLSWCRQLSLTFYPCAAMKYWAQQMAGMKSSTPTVSVSVNFFVLIFCFMELTIMNLLPKDKPLPECPCILGWTEKMHPHTILKFHFHWHWESVKACFCLWGIASDVPTWPNCPRWSLVLLLSEIWWMCRYQIFPS